MTPEEIQKLMEESGSQAAMTPEGAYFDQSIDPYFYDMYIEMMRESAERDGKQKAPPKEIDPVLRAFYGEDLYQQMLEDQMR